MGEGSQTRYTVEVKTGTRRSNSTDSNITIAIHGKENTVTDVPLAKSLTNADPFEQGRIDKFQIDAPYLGKINEVVLTSDKSGKGASWYVQWVKIVHSQDNGAKDAEFVFHFNTWFSNKNGWTHSAKQSLSVDAVKPVEGYSVEHHTEKFKQSEQQPRIFLRRGVSVRFQFSFSRSLTNSDRELKLVFSTGNRPRESSGTQVVVNCYNEDEYKKRCTQNKWAFEILTVQDDDVVIELFTPSDALVGSFQMEVELNDDVIFKYGSHVVILFNPWNEGDEVHMKSQNDLNEYVLSESGIVYQGTGRQPYPKKWYFGQFEAIVADVILHLLQEIPIKSRRSAVDITRAFSSRLNSFDNDGVLEGNWSGDYEGGKTPSFWTTTPSILQQYADQGFKPVKYGQCWVFSAIAVTAMRFLGIPCRSVTNFDSAHDTDANVTHDVYFDADMNYDKDKTNDSVWNFHVWNDVYMKRNDLEGDEWDGWQTIDATPQEMSSDIYQTGPAPLSAVKSGRVNQNYDTKFVFAEVNAQTLYWKINKDGKEELIQSRTDRVGHTISTKAVGSMWRNDVTDEYKFPDGSILESAAVKTALHIVDHKVLESNKSALSINLSPVREENFVGQPIDVQVKVKNDSNEDQSVRIKVISQLIQYTGEVARSLEASNDDLRKIKIAKKSDTTLMISIQPNQYVPYLHADECLRLYVTAVVPEYSTRHVAMENIRISLSKPELKIMVDESTEIISGEPFKVSVEFENPLNIALKNCEACFGGSTVLKAIYDQDIPDVKPNTIFRKEYYIKPIEVKGVLQKKSLLFSFACHPIGGFNSSIHIRVSEKKL